MLFLKASLGYLDPFAPRNYSRLYRLMSTRGHQTEWEARPVRWQLKVKLLAHRKSGKILNERKRSRASRL